MKRIIFYIVTIILISFLIVGCTNRDSSDENSQLPEVMNQQEQSNNQLVEYKGQVAIITEDVILRDPYVITIDSNNNPIYQKLENEEFSLNKNDMVIVIEEHNDECRIVQAFGDVPRIRGTIEKSKLSYDKSLFRDNANQAIVNNAMSYDGVDGNEKGIQYGAGIILERKEGWVKMSIPMEESELWFKLDDLSFEFDTSITDIKH
ncbi:hypothetical protein [Defluviitalea phaphyphila]|uniref:hypothetical protein n=1 Tax=Defluviitalea phaphyphila TaxID=1473580 RepID=UPI000730CCE5|nr:hypothetical protein [Defluviitalea phaphyphila]